MGSHPGLPGGAGNALTWARYTPADMPGEHPGVVRGDRPHLAPRPEGPPRRPRQRLRPPGTPRPANPQAPPRLDIGTRCALAALSQVPPAPGRCVMAWQLVAEVAGPLSVLGSPPAERLLLVARPTGASTRPRECWPAGDDELCRRTGLTPAASQCLRSPVSPRLVESEVRVPIRPGVSSGPGRVLAHGAPEDLLGYLTGRT